jgi:hypothetical protein
VLDPAVMVVIGTIVVLLPFVLAVVLHGPNRADARGRRTSRRWMGRPLVPERAARATEPDAR